MRKKVAGTLRECSQCSRRGVAGPGPSSNVRATTLRRAVPRATSGVERTARSAVAPALAPLSWENPVVADDFPDPSAARVDGVAWATATSSARAPGFPLLRSTDLVHWDEVGSVFHRPPAWSTGSLWAPELVVDE